MSYKITIDAGHGGTDPGACGSRYQEKNIVLAMCRKLDTLLKGYGLETIMTRETDVFVPLTNRAQIANNYGADFFISIHTNSAANSAANGIETLVYGNTGESSKIAAIIQNNMVKATGRANRGVKERPDLAVLNSTKMAAALVEAGFICNDTEEQLLGSEEYQDAIVDAIAHGIYQYFYGAAPQAETSPSATAAAGTPIIASPTATAAQGKAWAESKKAAPFFIGLADTFWKLGQASGIDPVVIYTQSAKETGYGKFGGVIDETYCNPCGMKTSAGGGDYDTTAHMKFASWGQGIQAQIDHIALYAGADGYPKVNTPDPRHFAYLNGKCKTVESLGGSWAPSATYGSDIVKMMKELMTMEKIDNLSTANEIPEWQKNGLQNLVEAKVIADTKYWENKILQNITVGEVLGLLGNTVKSLK